MKYLIWFAVALIRFVLWVLGWFLTPLYINIETERTAGMSWRERYVEHAFRNPTPYLRGLLKQPVPETQPNPDFTVRSGLVKKDTRRMEHGIFWEYWSLSAMKNGKYWEFRIGWKFVDGNDAFYPTLQLGPKR